MKYYNIRITGRNLFEQLEKKYLRTYDNIRKITTSKRNCYATDC